MMDVIDQSTLLYCKIILMVDSEKTIVALASELYSEQSCQILSACDNKHALPLLEEKTIELMTYDVIMPNMAGCELAELVQRLYPHSKLQMNSDFLDQEDADSYNNRSSNTLLHHPYTANTIVKRLRSLTEPNHNASVLRNYTVLVVDDKDKACDLLRINLEKFGCRTIRACSDSEAINRYRQSFQKGNSIDAVVLGRERQDDRAVRDTADMLRAIDPCVKTIVASEHKQWADIASGYESGKNYSVGKSYDSNAIKQMLQQVVDEGQAALALE